MCVILTDLSVPVCQWRCPSLPVLTNKTWSRDTLCLKQSLNLLFLSFFVWCRGHLEAFWMRWSINNYFWKANFQKVSQFTNIDPTFFSVSDERFWSEARKRARSGGVVCKQMRMSKEQNFLPLHSAPMLCLYGPFLTRIDCPWMRWGTQTACIVRIQEHISRVNQRRWSNQCSLKNASQTQH